MLTILGRANSVNVMKVLWCLEELGWPYERHDAGMQYGVVNTPEYRAKNPNGRVPTLVDGDFVLWESNSILRYLCLKAGGDAGGLYPSAPAARASVDRWLDWQLSIVSPAERNLFWGMVRTPEDKRDYTLIDTAVKEMATNWAIIEDRLGDGRTFLEGEHLTIADIVLGCYARRWFGAEVQRPGMPELPAMRAWFGRLEARPGFRTFVAPKLF